MLWKTVTSLTLSRELHRIARIGDLWLFRSGPLRGNTRRATRRLSPLRANEEYRLNFTVREQRVG